MTLLGEEIAVYGLPEATDTIRAFPLTEGIAVAEERIYIASELMRFLPRKLWKAFDCDWCFSMPVSE